MAHPKSKAKLIKRLKLQLPKANEEDSENILKRIKTLENSSDKRR